MKQILLSVLTSIYSAVTRVRNGAYDHQLIPTYKARLPVISVGNVTVGGSGKSPISGYLAEGLLKRKVHPSILLRGYKGREAGPYLLRGTETPLDVGDESLMHFDRFHSQVPVVVARRRVAGAKMIEEELEVQCIVLDDGFQHRRLQRDFNILLIDCEQLKQQGPLSSQALLPLGRLREQPDSAIGRADCVFFIYRSKHREDDVVPEVPCPSFTVLLEPYCFRNLATGETRALEHFKGQEVSALTAIAQPKPFFQSLKNLGLKINETLSYPDHYVFHGHELSSPSTLIVTEKDSAKIKRLPQVPQHVWALILGVHFVSEEEKFWELLEKHAGDFEDQSNRRSNALE